VCGATHQGFESLTLRSKPYARASNLSAFLSQGFVLEKLYVPGPLNFKELHIFRKLPSFTGIVEKGSGEGAMIGFRTANIPLEDATVSGIYAATVRVDDTIYSAAVYADQRRKLLEAHLLDFTGDLYGKEITIILREKIREDRKFDDLESLKGAIAADIEAIRKSFPH
jgi:FAD synthase